MKKAKKHLENVNAILIVAIVAEVISISFCTTAKMSNNTPYCR